MKSICLFSLSGFVLAATMCLSTSVLAATEFEPPEISEVDFVFGKCPPSSLCVGKMKQYLAGTPWAYCLVEHATDGALCDIGLAGLEEYDYYATYFDCAKVYACTENHLCKPSVNVGLTDGLECRGASPSAPAEGADSKCYETQCVQGDCQYVTFMDGEPCDDISPVWSPPCNDQVCIDSQCVVVPDDDDIGAKCVPYLSGWSPLTTADSCFLGAGVCADWSEMDEDLNVCAPVFRASGDCTFKYGSYSYTGTCNPLSGCMKNEVKDDTLGDFSPGETGGGKFPLP